jgi:hypothetical protein
MENHSTKQQQHGSKPQKHGTKPHAPTSDTYGKKSERQRQKEKAAVPKQLQFEKKGTHIKFDEDDVTME